MTAQLLNGTELADKILLSVKNKVDQMENKPGLAAILVGDNEASQLYLKLKENACNKAGIIFSNYKLSANCSEEEILQVISFLNQESETNGIIVQLPLPKQFNKEKIISAISPEKDIDGFLPSSKFTSPNILGIIELLKATTVSLKNKNIVVLSNSEIFSQPFKKLLPDSEITYLSPQAPSSKLIAQCQLADVLIVAVGKPMFIKPKMIKKDVILIDVGINKIKGKTNGDIDPTCDKIASWRSPVPGGVGPMTIAMLLRNLVNLN